MASRVWKRWKRFAHRAAEIQSFLLLTVLYWLIVVPIGLLRKRRSAAAPPKWILREESGPVGLDDARRQY
jgi:hypothetical protein